MLADEDFIGLPLEMETGVWQNLAAVMPPGKSPRIVQRASDASVILALMAAGIGISVLSEAFTRVNMPDVAFRKIAGATRVAEHCVVYRKNEIAPAVMAYVKFLRTQAPSP
jgi:DNA-binding transcriptional LysR family regulator